MSHDHIDYISQIELKAEDKEETSLRKKNENEPINLPSFGDINSNNYEKQSESSEVEYSENLKVQLYNKTSEFYSYFLSYKD